MKENEIKEKLEFIDEYLRKDDTQTTFVGKSF